MYSRLWGGRFLSHLRSLVCVSALDLCSRSVCGVWSCETCSSVSVFIESLKNSRVCAQWVTLFLLLFLWKLPGNLSGISHCYLLSWWHHPHVHAHVSCAPPNLPTPALLTLCVCVCVSAAVTLSAVAQSLVSVHVSMWDLEASAVVATPLSDPGLCLWILDQPFC